MPSTKPCPVCPWLSKAERDIEICNTPEMKHAALSGSLFMCHHTGGATQCAGVTIWREQQKDQNKMNLTPQELKLARKCVKWALDLRVQFVSTLKAPMEAGAYRQEPTTVRKYKSFVAVEIPQLTALLKKLKGGK